MDRTLGCYDPINRCFCKRVKLPVITSHEIWLEKITTVSVVLKFALESKAAIVKIILLLHGLTLGEYLI